MVDFRVAGSVDLDIRKFMAGATAVQKKLNSLTKDVAKLDAAVTKLDAQSISINVDFRGATKEIAELQAQIKALESQDIDLDVDVHKDLMNLGNAARYASSGIGGGGGGSGHTALIGSLFLLGTALLPLAPLLVGVAGAAVSSFAVAGAAVGGFAVFAIPTISKVAQGYEELKKAEDKLAQATSKKEIKAATAELNEVLKKLDKEGLTGAVRAIQRFRKNFERITGALQPKIISLMEESLIFLTVALLRLKPVAEQAALGLQDVLRMAQAGIQGESWTRFFEYLTENAREFIRVWGEALGNFLTGVMNLIVAFDPLTKDFNAGFLDMSRRFLEWSKNLEDNEGFKNFVNYVLTKGKAAWQGFKDFVSVLYEIGVALTPIGERLLEGFTQLSNWASSLKEMNPQLFNAVVQLGFLAAVLIPIVSFIKPLIAGFMGISRGFAAILGVSTPLGAAILIVAGLLAFLGRKSDEARKFFSRLGEIWDQIKGAAQRVWEKLQPLKQTLQEQVAPKFYEALNNILDIVEKIIPVIEFLIPIIGWILTEAIDMAVDAFLGLTEAVKGIIKFFEGLIEFLTGVFTGDWGKAWEGIKTMAEGIWEAIKGAFKFLINVTIFKIGKIGLRLFKGMWKGGWNSIKKVAKNIWNGIKNVIRNAINLVKNIIRGAMKIVKAIFRGDFRYVWNKAKSGMNKAAQLTQKGVNKLKNAVKKGINKVKSWFKGLPGKIKSALGNLGRLLWNAGRSILSGLLDGLKSKWGDVKNFVGGIGDWISDHKGPKQYDLGLLKPAGNWIMEGLQRGLASGLRPVLRDVGSVGGMIADQIGRSRFETSGNFAANVNDVVNPNNDIDFRDRDDLPREIRVILEIAKGGDKKVAELINYLLRMGLLNIKAEAVDN